MGEKGCPIVGDQPPWKRKHTKLQLPNIHHGRGNTQKTITFLILPTEGVELGGREREIEKLGQGTKKIHGSIKIVTCVVVVGF
jgi:hypothetical protein